MALDRLKQPKTNTKATTKPRKNQRKDKPRKKAA
jgi:hypothetical protein